MDALLNQTIFSDDGNKLFWQISVALAAIIIVLTASRLLSIVAGRVGYRLSQSPSVANLFRTTVHLVGIVITLFIVLRIFKLDGVAFSLLAGAGVIGLVIGFAVQDIAANFISGVILVILRPFRVGYLVETNDVYGIVKQIRLRSTEIRTLDGQMVHIPNKSILLEKVVVYTDIPSRRVRILIGVDYDTVLDSAKKLAQDTVAQLDKCDERQAVSVYYTEFAESSIVMEIQFWTEFHTEPEYLEARSQAIVALKQAFDKAGITIPYPITTVRGTSSKSSQASAATRRRR